MRYHWTTPEDAATQICLGMSSYVTELSFVQMRPGQACILSTAIQQTNSGGNVKGVPFSPKVWGLLDYPVPE